MIDIVPANLFRRHVVRRAENLAGPCHLGHDASRQAEVQCVEGVRHTRGTPPAVVEMDAETWIDLATGALAWPDAEHSARVRASGERADLTPYLPLG